MKVGLVVITDPHLCGLGDASNTVSGAVYIAYGSGCREDARRNFEVFNYVWGNEVVGCSTI